MIRLAVAYICDYKALVSEQQKRKEET